MKFNTSKNKIDKIDKNQGDLDNSLIQKENRLKNLKSSDTIIKTFTTLFESDYQVFSTDRVFGGQTSTNIDIPIVAQDVDFIGSLNISERLIPYIKHKIIVKKPIIGDIRGIYIATITGYDSEPTTQTGSFRQNVNVFDSITGDFIRNTGFGSGTDPVGDALVTQVLHPLFVIIQQKSVYSEDSSRSINWEKVTNNVYNFSIESRVMFVVPSDNENSSSNREGTYINNAGFNNGNIVNYERTDNTFFVNYPIYSPVEADIEAKLILSIPPNNIWENYSQYK